MYTVQFIKIWIPKGLWSSSYLHKLLQTYQHNICTDFVMLSATSKTDPRNFGSTSLFRAQQPTSSFLSLCRFYVTFISSKKRANAWKWIFPPAFSSYHYVAPLDAVNAPVKSKASTCVIFISAVRYPTWWTPSAKKLVWLPVALALVCWCSLYHPLDICLVMIKEVPFFSFKWEYALNSHSQILPCLCFLRNLNCFSFDDAQ